MQLVAEGLGRTVQEKPVGFKYIAAEMLAGEVLVGGEESGGVGFGMHLPERDALFAALLCVKCFHWLAQHRVDAVARLEGM
jgi:phosphomannomutase